MLESTDDIALELHQHGFSYGISRAISEEGEVKWIVDACKESGKRVVAEGHSQLGAMLELRTKAHK